MPPKGAFRTPQKKWIKDASWVPKIHVDWWRAQCAFGGIDGSGHYRNVDLLQDRLRGHEVDPVLEDLVELERKSILEFKKCIASRLGSSYAAFREQQAVCHSQECTELPYQDDEEGNIADGIG